MMTHVSRPVAAALGLALAVAAGGCAHDASSAAPSGHSGIAATTTAAAVTNRPASYAPTDHSSHRAGHVTDAVTFHQDMRKLWEDHITWTRLYIVSAVAGLPDLDATAARLLQNQADIGHAVVPFYGKKAGAALTRLLRDHILIAADLVTAAKEGDSQAVTTQKNRWYANADDIAEFLAAANPEWPVDTLKEMMHTHLDQTLAEATARLTGDWDADITAYDAIHVHILAMADALADGIVAQFPHRFAG
jgi:hypothetical protein